MDMLTEVNLKDKEYLKAYEEQIRTLPLDELYEVLDIIKRDPSRERIDIVEKRIQELEGTTFVEKKIEKSQIELQPNSETQVKKDEAEESKSETFYINQPSSNYKGILSERELAEARLFAHLVDEKYKNAPPPPRLRTPVDILVNLFFFTLVFGSWIFITAIGGYHNQKGTLVYYPEHSISDSIAITSYFCLVGCFIFARCYKKEGSIGVGIAGFFWIKSFWGFLKGIYPGFFVTPNASLSRIISMSILILSSLFVVKVITTNEKSYMKKTLLMVLFCIAVEQIGWLEYL